MTISQNPREASPLIRGGIFSQRIKKSVKKRPESIFKERARDYKQILEEIILSFTEPVDLLFPDANFLHRNHVPGSDIEKGTKLSFILLACFGLSQMTLKPELVENYRRTLKEFLDKHQHNPSNKALYTELLSIIHVYQSMAKAIANQEQLTKELSRLEGLDLTSKAIDSHLQKKWIEPTLLKPIAELTAQIGKAMRLNDRLASPKLAGQSNSLAGLSRLVATSKKTPKKQKINEVSTEHRENDTPSQHISAAPAA